MEDIKSLSLVEVAIEIQSESKEKTTFIDLYNKVSEAKGFNEEEKRAHIAQFYTDVTASGDFVYCGGDLWDLKKNQKLEALETEFYTEHAGLGDDLEDEDEAPVKKKRKSSKKIMLSPEELEEEENKEEIDNEDESYENISFDDYEASEDDDDYSSYEKDLDSELDEEDKESYDDEDEDKYNSIMDEFENLYDD